MRTQLPVDAAQPSPGPGGGAHGQAHQVAARGHGPARALAYELLVTCQLRDGADTSPAAAVVADQARVQGWLDVRALATYAVIIGQCLHAPGRPGADAEVADFVCWAQASGDAFAVALSLTARAGTSILRDQRDARIDDLIGAYVAAEQVSARAERAFALHEIAANLHDLHMWELAAELLTTVAELAAGLHRPRALVGALAFNRHAMLTSELLSAVESGRPDAVAAQADRVDYLAALPLDEAIPVEWRTEVEAYRAICATLLRGDGGDGPGRIAGLLAAPVAGRVTQIEGLLQCVLGWYQMERGAWDAAEPLVREGAARILDSTDPAWRSFALWLRALQCAHAAGTDDLQPLIAYHGELRREVERSRRALSRSTRARLQTERLRVERDRFAQESQTDPLTGIANRRALETRLVTLSAPSTMIIVDIDRFKAVNDRFGHDVGDQVLHRIGHILRDCVRPGDLAARLGGDEFVLVMDTADAEVAVRRGHEVRDRIRSEPWEDISRGLRVAASVGVACGQVGETALYRAADTALYEAKRAGGARVRAQLPGTTQPAAGSSG